MGVKTDDFDQFWAEYPRHLGKLAAMKAYAHALKLATPEQILAGLMVFKQHLPRKVEFIPHASTWLNTGRWMDEYDESYPRLAEPVNEKGEDWFHECQRLHELGCGGRVQHGIRMYLDREKAKAKAKP